MRYSYRSRYATRRPPSRWKEVYYYIVENPLKGWKEVNEDLGKPYGNWKSCQKGTKRAAQRANWPWPPRNSDTGEVFVTIDEEGVPKLRETGRTWEDTKWERTAFLAQIRLRALSGRYKTYKEIADELGLDTPFHLLKAQVTTFSIRNGLSVPDLPTSDVPLYISWSEEEEKCLHRAYISVKRGRKNWTEAYESCPTRYITKESFFAAVRSYAKKKRMSGEEGWEWPLIHIESVGRGGRKAPRAMPSKLALRKLYEYKARYPKTYLADIRVLFLGKGYTTQKDAWTLSRIAETLSLPKLSGSPTVKKREEVLRALGVGPLKEERDPKRREALEAAAILRIKFPRRPWADIYWEVDTDYSSTGALSRAVRAESKKHGWVL